MARRWNMPGVGPPPHPVVVQTSRPRPPSWKPNGRTIILPFAFWFAHPGVHPPLSLFTTGVLLWPSLDCFRGAFFLALYVVSSVRGWRPCEFFYAGCMLGGMREEAIWGDGVCVFACIRSFLRESVVTLKHIGFLIIRFLEKWYTLSIYQRFGVYKYFIGHSFL